MTNSTLAAIENKVRKITRSPSTQQLSKANLDEYINTFMLYDMPEQLRLFALRTTIEFYLQPYEDLYVTDTSLAATDPLYNFKNKYITTHEPIYVAGYQTKFSQSREQFFNAYPQTSLIATRHTGNGVLTAFAGTLSSFPVVKRNVSFVSRDAGGDKMVLYDDGDGLLIGDGNGIIAYETGAYILNFTNAPADKAAITAMTVPYVASRPQSILYFDNAFTVRPIPDKAYKVSMEVYIRPTELVDGASPELEQWWQYVALRSSQKIFLDRMDMDSYNLIDPMAKEQELLALRRTIVQQSNERTSTIYTESTDFGLRGGSGNY